MTLRFARSPAQAPNFKQGGRPIAYGNGVSSPQATVGARPAGAATAYRQAGPGSPAARASPLAAANVAQPRARGATVIGTTNRPSPRAQFTPGGTTATGQRRMIQHTRSHTATEGLPQASPKYRFTGASSATTAGTTTTTTTTKTGQPVLAGTPGARPMRAGSAARPSPLGRHTVDSPAGTPQIGGLSRTSAPNQPLLQRTSVPTGHTRQSSQTRPAAVAVPHQGATTTKTTTPLRQPSQQQRAAIPPKYNGATGTSGQQVQAAHQTRNQPRYQQGAAIPAPARRVSDDIPPPRRGSGGRGRKSPASPVERVRAVTREHSHRQYKDTRPVRRFSEEGGGNGGQQTGTVVVRRESSFGRNGVHSLPRPVHSWNSTPPISEEGEDLYASAPSADYTEPSWHPQQHRPNQPVEKFNGVEVRGNPHQHRQQPGQAHKHEHRGPAYNPDNAHHRPQHSEVAPQQPIYAAGKQQQQRPGHRPREENVSRHLSRCPIPPSPGQFELHYRVISQLGEGAFADVMKAQNLETGEEVAVKIIQKTRWKHQPGILGSLFQELEVLHNVYHGNIVQFYEYFETKETLYIVMELVSGGDLLDHIEGAPPMAETEAAEVISQVCRALVFLHNKGIIHRDLKPENILLDQPNSTQRIKLCDFGQAVFHSTTHDFEIFGTPEYCAPEVLRHVQSQVRNPALDMWSLGVVTFVLCSGVFPYPGTTEEQMARSIMTGNRVRRNFSRGLDDFLNKLLTLDPAKRPTAEQALEHPWLQKGRQYTGGARQQAVPKAQPAQPRQQAAVGGKVRVQQQQTTQQHQHRQRATGAPPRAPPRQPTQQQQTRTRDQPAVGTQARSRPQAQSRPQGQAHGRTVIYR